MFKVLQNFKVQFIAQTSTDALKYIGDFKLLSKKRGKEYLSQRRDVLCK